MTFKDLIINHYKKTKNQYNKIMKIAVLASHNGSNLQSIIDAIENGELKAEVSVVISNNSTSGALKRAKKHNIPGIHLSNQLYPDFHKLDEVILSKITESNSDIIFLAGYMKKIGSKVLSSYNGKILNTHPALLPKFGGKGMYGMNVHKAVLESNEDYTGITIHLVNSEYDEGKIISQSKVPVFENDTPDQLCNRVMARERKFIVETLNKINSGEILL